MAALVGFLVVVNVADGCMTALIGFLVVVMYKKEVGCLSLIPRLHQTPHTVTAAT
jgi:hypothetical protein